MISKQPKLAPVPTKEEYHLLEDYDANIPDVAHVWVPKGFTYDGASIPTPAWSFITSPFNPLIMAPALIHDWLYYTHQTTRNVADTIFYNMLIDNGMGSGKAWVVYSAVDLAGDLYWNNEDDLDKFLDLYKKNPDPKFHFPQSVIDAASD